MYGTINCTLNLICKCCIVYFVLILLVIFVCFSRSGTQKELEEAAGGELCLKGERVG